MSKGIISSFFVGSVCLFLAVAVSCSKTDKNMLFQQKLDAIDSLIQNDDSQKASTRLHALRKRAQFPVQYLSIAKRELQLHMPAQALQSVQAGLKKHPNDNMLKAVLAHTLLAAQRVDDAVEASKDLLETPYAGIGSEAFIQADKLNKTYQTPVEFWKVGFRLTGEHTFLENAGLMLACRGDITAAAALRNAISREETLRSPYFWSCLAYDIGDFKPVLDDLFFSLVYTDMAGLPENNRKAFEYARRHILLAADASAGLGDMEQARGFWQMYVDRYPDASSDIFYNLAMTAPSQHEKIETLIDCLAAAPDYYPAVAQYVRAWAAMHNAHAEKNTLTEFLKNRDFFSLEMEKALFLSSSFMLTAEQVLENASAANTNDPRFLLEYFRYKYVQPKNYTQGNGEMWKILEKKPDETPVKSYARWYFAGSGDFNACFGIEKTDDYYEDMFYDGIRYAVQGSSLHALNAFSEAQKDERYMCPAIVNQAYIYTARNEPDKAIKYFVRAANLISDNLLRSKLLYEAAQLFAERNGVPEAIRMLNRALELDPDNHRAAVLRQKLNRL